MGEKVSAFRERCDKTEVLTFFDRKKESAEQKSISHKNAVKAAD